MSVGVDFYMYILFSPPGFGEYICCGENFTSVCAHYCMFLLILIFRCWRKENNVLAKWGSNFFVSNTLVNDILVPNTCKCSCIIFFAIIPRQNMVDDTRLLMTILTRFAFISHIGIWTDVAQGTRVRLEWGISESSYCDRRRYTTRAVIHWYGLILAYRDRCIMW
mgnify:CR=1 FL=1